MRASRVDPYEQWLSIPKSERPVDYYRLLGVARFEDQTQTIARAAQLRLDTLESFRQGEHAETCQRVIREVAAAKRCLLDSGQKAKYDAMLQAKVGAGKPADASSTTKKPRRLKESVPVAVSGTVSGVVPRSKPQAVAQTPRSIEVDSGQATSSVRLPRRSQKSSRKIWIIGGVLGAIGVAAALLLLRPVDDSVDRGGPSPVSRVPPTKPQPTPVRVVEDPSARVKSEEEQAPTEVQVVRVQAGADEATNSSSEREEESGERTIDSDASVVKGVAGGEKGVAAHGEESTERDAKSPPETLSDLLEKENSSPEPAGGGSTAAKTSRQKIPETRDAEAALKLIEEVYAAEIAKAEKSSSAKVEFAKLLFKQARESGKDPIAQYVLYREAAENVSAAGNFLDAWEVWEELASKFEVDVLEQKAEALEQASRIAKLPAHYQVVAESWRTLATESIHRADFTLAAKYASRGVNAARRSRDVDLRKDAEQWEKQLAEREAAHQAAQEAEATLDAEPNNANALATLGLYRSVDREAWKEGAKLLAQSNQPELRQIGEAELKAPRDEQECLKLADAWWKLAEVNSGGYRASGMRERAVHWYREALPQLTGLSRAVAERRIEEAQPKVYGEVEPIVIDNRDAGFSTVGFVEWVPQHDHQLQEVFKGSMVIDDAKKEKQPGTFARFTPTIQRAGRYQVWFGFRANQSSSRSRNVPISIKYADGIVTLALDQTGPISLVSKSLGVYRFEKGTGGFVQVNNIGTESKWVVADVVKFEFVGP